MRRAALDVGAFPWGRVQRLFDADVEVHWRRCEAQGLQCPQEVFSQLFHGESADGDLASIARSIDWGRVRWQLEEFSGSALRQVRIERGAQHAVDEARRRAALFGIRDDRPEVAEHWRGAKSWLMPPVIAAGSVLGSSVSHQLLVGCTRLGYLLGLMDGATLAEDQRHLVWVGRGFD